MEFLKQRTEKNCSVWLPQSPRQEKFGVVQNEYEQILIGKKRNMMQVLDEAVLKGQSEQLDWNWGGSEPAGSHSSQASSE